MFFILVTIGFIVLLFYYDYDNVIFSPIKKLKNHFNSNIITEEEKQSKININTEWSFDISEYGNNKKIYTRLNILITKLN